MYILKRMVAIKKKFLSIWVQQRNLEGPELSYEDLKII